MKRTSPASQQAPQRADRRGPLPVWLLLAVVAATGINLRASFGSVPALLNAISRDLALDATTAALLTSVPVLCMGLFAPVAQRLAARTGTAAAAAALLGLLALSGLMRLGVGSAGTLLLSSALAGAAMGGVSALMPALIAHHLPRIPGTATGIYSMAMAGGVAVAAWIAGPTAELLGGWRLALALWGLIAGLAALCWSALLPRLSVAGKGGGSVPRPRVVSPAAAPGPHRLPWRSPIARWVTAFSTLNMLVGFSGVAWIAPTFVDHGFAPQRAAGLFALFQFVQIAAMLTLPPLTDVTRDRRPLLAVTAVCTCLGVAGMAAAPTELALPAVLLFGTGVGGSSALALVLVQDVTDSQTEAGRLGAMVLLVSFLAAAFGPLLLGTLRDLTDGFTAGYGVLLALAVVKLLTLPAFRPGRTINELPPPSGVGARVRRRGVLNRDKELRMTQQLHVPDTASGSLTAQATELLVEYARAADNHDLDALRSLFTADATLTDRTGTRNGLEECMTLYADLPPYTKHLITNVQVRQDPDGLVHANAYLQAVVRTAAGTSLVFGEYHDQLRVEEGRLRIAHKGIAVDHVQELSAAAPAG